MLLYFRELDELQEQLVGSEGKLSAIRKVSASHTFFSVSENFFYSRIDYFLNLSSNMSIGTVLHLI